MATESIAAGASIFVFASLDAPVRIASTGTLLAVSTLPVWTRRDVVLPTPQDLARGLVVTPDGGIFSPGSLENHYDLDALDQAAYDREIKAFKSNGKWRVHQRQAQVFVGSSITITAPALISDGTGDGIATSVDVTEA